MSLGYWTAHHTKAIFCIDDWKQKNDAVRETVVIIKNTEYNTLGIGMGGMLSNEKNGNSFQVVGILPPLFPEWLGDRSFRDAHGLRFAYVGGAMARGIASAGMVSELAKSGSMGFFGAAGLSLERLQTEINIIRRELDPSGLPWGMNFIHTPDNPELEWKIIDLYVANGVMKIEAAAFMTLSAPIVYYAFKGLKRGADGAIIRRNNVFAKISRPEVAHHFLSPVPTATLDLLVQEGRLTREEAELGRHIPIAEDITIESDSGGHTDGRPLGPLFSCIMKMRNELCNKFNYPVKPRLGAAGGLGTPSAIAAAYAMGAAYVCVGSVHQSSVESGVGNTAKKMLEKTGLADCCLTACADMFEQGVKVQVLKKGTMMPHRGNYLYKLYTSYPSLGGLPESDVLKLQKEIFRMTLEEVCEETRKFFMTVSPAQVTRAERDPKHKMALVFRWYIGKSSHWPIMDITDRQIDYQLWCSPALGAFNEWVKGTFLEKAENRTIRQVSLNLVEGAAYITRMQQLRTYGIDIPEDFFQYTPELLQITQNER